MSEPRRKRTRRIAAVGLAILALVVAGLAWNMRSLRGLPDIGDPFDVAAFVSGRVPDEDNAFVFYRRADALYRDWNGVQASSWASASTDERKWLQDNRETMALWKEGAEKPDACVIPRAEMTVDANLDVLNRFRSLCRLACLEALRREAGGDFEGAWDWYRAALRASRHCGQRGCLIERLVGIAVHASLVPRISAWADSPKVDAGMLRRGLADVQEIDAMTAPMSVALKCEYLSLLNALGRPDFIWKFIEREAGTPSPTSGRVRISVKSVLLRARSILVRDPERSRRVLRLVFANWLAYGDRPPDQRPPLEPDSNLVYRADSSAPPSARMLTPEQVQSWLESTLFANELLPAIEPVRRAIDRERSRQAALVLALANALDERATSRGEPVAEQPWARPQGPVAQPEEAGRRHAPTRREAAMTEPRLKRARRIAAVVLAILALVVAGLAWNMTSLRGLPDIGDPFDVAAFTSVRVRDEDNAIVLYRRADALYRDWDGVQASSWASASADERKWLEDNREALAIWKQGTEKPGACITPPDELAFDASVNVLHQLKSLCRLACLEASRREAGGDFEGAWDWYRASLRASRHCGQRGCLIERLIGAAIHARLVPLITAWAGSPKVDAGMLRRALAEVQEIDAMTPPLSVAIKCEYLSFLNALGRPDFIWRFMEPEASTPIPTSGRAQASAKTILLRARSILITEPERSRRVLRLIVANWLAYCDLPAGRRPPLVPDSDRRLSARLVRVAPSGR